MKKTVLTIVFMIGCLSAFSQISIPLPSPTATLQQKVGLTDVKVVYSRPGVKNRHIFGDLISYGEVWRTGANASTKISFDGDVRLADNDVPAGTYALYTIPGEKEWTIIVHKNTELWGAANYKEEEDLVRFKVPVRKLTDAVETFTIDFSHFMPSSAQIDLKWENILVSIPIEAEIDSKIMAQIKEQITDAKGEVSPQLYAGAATYYYESGKDLNQAIEWLNKAVEANPEAFWLIHTKAKILAKQGKKEEAIAAAEKSIELAKNSPQGDFGYVKNNEYLIAEIKSGK